MPCVYTQWVDAHCCLPLNTFCNLPDFNRSEENVENVFLNYDRPSHGLLLSQRLIASHPQQDDCKSTKKNWDLQESQKDLTNPNKIVDDLLLKQIRMGSCIKQT